MQLSFNQMMKFLAVFLAVSVCSVSLVADSSSIDVGGQQLAGAWIITLSHRKLSSPSSHWYRNQLSRTTRAR